ncbi:PREDICTED: uncharacterized protein LOC108356805, partial [Rhagoletis zephyria]|uniref:uncharacterized protein LOC108356805 n=1 Tax=Rhagoletis zephyria TaxID=28612 RepID=UPI0008112F72
WLTEAEDGEKKRAFCKWCKITLRAHSKDLQKYGKTQGHQNKGISFQTLPGQTRLPFPPAESEQSKINDLKLAAFIAVHCAVRGIDHLTDILRKLDKNFDKLKKHRTKCGNVIRNVIGPSLLEDLVDDISNSPFSLIVDKSTNISVMKYLCICVKYYSESRKEVTTSFLAIVAVDSTTAEELYDHTTIFLKSINMRLSNLVGIGTDGAANLC